METIEKYVPLKDLKNEKFYKKVNVGKIDAHFKWGYIALDGLQRIITIESNPEEQEQNQLF
jgi:hypothetical protein